MEKEDAGWVRGALAVHGVAARQHVRLDVAPGVAAPLRLGDGDWLLSSCGSSTSWRRVQDGEGGVRGTGHRGSDSASARHGAWWNWGKPLVVA